jgi:hypothetical protein
MSKHFDRIGVYPDEIINWIWSAVEVVFALVNTRASGSGPL